ncbi:uncharacterized protein LOC109924401 [Rhincodon typus]|uniref:uncharacterized protein LOC109924401 n=1 Tax=Rhincodon typus TaxID=259920 RepID=UPI00202DD43B|nr:uncharacterized protein LOC109924401 [Rhincodon typus]
MNTQMDWRSLASLLLFPVQMVFYVVKAAVSLLLPARPRELSRDTVLITGGGRGIGRHLALEFAKQGARKNLPRVICTLVSKHGGPVLSVLIAVTPQQHKLVEPESPFKLRLNLLLYIKDCIAFIFQIIYLKEVSLLDFQCPNAPRVLALSSDLQAPIAPDSSPGTAIPVYETGRLFYQMWSIAGPVDAFSRTGLGSGQCQSDKCRPFLPSLRCLHTFQPTLSLRSIYAGTVCRPLGVVLSRNVIPLCIVFSCCRFPKLFPPLKPDTVARRTVEAVQTNQALLLLPWTMHLLVIMKSILPHTALEEIYRFTGSYACMDSFKGRT